MGGSRVHTSSGSNEEESQRQGNSSGNHFLWKFKLNEANVKYKRQNFECFPENGRTPGRRKENWYNKNRLCIFKLFILAHFNFEKK